MTRARDIANFGDGIATADIGDGEITAAKLASGAITSAALPAGSVLQVVQAVTSTETVMTSTSYVDVTGLSASITPSSASSKILIMCHPNARTRKQTIDFRNYDLRITRGGTEVFWGRLRDMSAGLGASSNHVANGNQNLLYLDSPNTTSSIEYKIQGRIDNAANTTQYAINTAAQGTEASLILMEIAG